MGSRGLYQIGPTCWDELCSDSRNDHYVKGSFLLVSVKYLRIKQIVYPSFDDMPDCNVTDCRFEQPLCLHSDPSRPYRLMIRAV
jgi:hypothetical protein